MSAPDTRLHATCVSLGGRGILLRGPSGSGKSDLAMRLIAEAGARLVADDQCCLSRRGGELIAAAPAAIAGCIEARGVGILRLPHESEAPVRLVVDLKRQGQVARLPEPATEELCGIDVRRVEIDPFESGAVAKLLLAAGHADATLIPLNVSVEDSRRQSREGWRAMHGNDGEEETRPAPSSGGGPSRGERLRVVLVTGMSGAGRSSTLKALEDVGYEAIDNLPLQLISPTVHEGGLTNPIAVGVDIRTRNFAVRPFLDALKGLDADDALDVTMVFVDCEDEVLRRRYTETRRRHPLAQGRPLSDGIAAERRLVAPLRRRADMTIDTSTLSVQDLRRVVEAQLGLGGTSGMAVFVVSFSYKNGLPREADVVFDARFLRNPHYDDALRPLTGQDRAVAEYVAADPDYPAFLDGVCDMLHRLIPRYQAEGKSYLTIAIGCTGGRHRSVTIAERVAEFLEKEGRHALVNHRELPPEREAGDARDSDSR
ncbi:RNase adapter RapZ [Ferruginivarius sediminum]|uniref:RNase adapter RapZ n=1 Tax=Ferruginivarius sediminum TaxID=2661937 RepID=A0A369T513_9PROT|nr:RNase adapter RapZ [Ferruginivarius sediminum]RDD60338.1 RNase adapter RapZ [Ferruginivarius sediminum]